MVHLLKNNQLITGLIPARNAETTISGMVKILKLYCDEVIVVDNNSVDLTAKEALHAGAFVILEQSIGKGYALKSGFRRCLGNLQCRAVITMDADGESDPSDTPRLLEKIIKKESELVFGVRTKTHSHIAFGHGTTGNVLKAISGIPLKDPMSGIRAYSRKSILQLLPKMTQTGFGIDFQIAVEAVMLGIKWCEVLVSGNSLISKDGWSINHVFSALENIIKYTSSGLFSKTTVLENIYWANRDNTLLILKTSEREYHFRRKNNLFIPQ